MKKALGKGLSALIPDSYINEIKSLSSSQATDNTPEAASFQLIPLSDILMNQDQPRRDFQEAKIEELAASIKENGILQPVVVKQIENGKYRLICGERRFRAARLCGLNEIPAVVKDVAPERFLEWALVENIQREDLNPLEEAEAYRRLVEEQTLSQDEIAKRVGKDRSTVANMLRLLRLPQEVSQYVEQGRLTAGHARALLGLLTPEHQRQLAKRIVEENLSVRQVEQIVNRSAAHKRRAKTARYLGPEIMDLENRLSRYLGTQVKIFSRKSQKEGRIEIRYFSLDDLERLLDKIGLTPSQI